MVAFVQLAQRDYTSFPTARHERDRESPCRRIIHLGELTKTQNLRAI
ncbi:hypothetical protein VCR14J2_210047 [Vibrio coralliirubri]|nr:hypothetical protein VCR14J2_210047 [Vibrio coralliirubri]